MRHPLVLRPVVACFLLGLGAGCDDNLPPGPDPASPRLSGVWEGRVAGRRFPNFDVVLSEDSDGRVRGEGEIRTARIFDRTVRFVFSAYGTNNITSGLSAAHDVELEFVVTGRGRFVLAGDLSRPRGRFACDAVTGATVSGVLRDLGGTLHDFQMNCTDGPCRACPG